MWWGMNAESAAVGDQLLAAVPDAVKRHIENMQALVCLFVGHIRSSR